MIAVVLAAGYATRLYPLTRDRAKPLLDVAGRSIIDRILDNAARIPGLTEVVVVTNARFYQQFCQWRDASYHTVPITVLNDGSTDNDNRLGALADLKFAVTARSIDTDTLVVAGDNLFDFELADFVGFFHRVRSDCITVHRQPDVERLRRTGVVELDTDDRVLSFAEKPAEPKSQWAVPPLYCYRGATLGRPLERFLASGVNADAPGAFVPWLIRDTPVYAFRFSGARHDIGNAHSYAEVQGLLAARERV